MRCVDTVSLGKVARSTNRTRAPDLASSIAVGAPAHRAPTTIASSVAGISGLHAGRFWGRRVEHGSVSISTDVRHCVARLLAVVRSLMAPRGAITLRDV